MEKIQIFGEHSNLLGILSESNTLNKSNDIPGVIILNAGLVNRTGPFRMSVELARLLAENGCNVLRFDLSGIGDSEKPNNDRRVCHKFLAGVAILRPFLQRKYRKGLPSRILWSASGPRLCRGFYRRLRRQNKRLHVLPHRRPAR